MLPHGRQNRYKMSVTRMKTILPILFLLAAAAPAFGQAGDAKKTPRKPPTAADWTALAKLPDFTGVWEAALGGGGRGNARGAADGAPATGAPGRRAAGRGRGAAAE